MMHYFIIILIVAIIVIIQLYSFKNTGGKIKNFLWIFPTKSDEYKLEKEALIEHINSAKDEDLEHMLAAAGLSSDNYSYVRINADGEKIQYFQEEIQYFQKEQARKDLIKLLASNANGIYVNHGNATLKTIADSINDYLKNNKSVSDFHLMKDIVDRNCDAKEEEINAQIPVPLYMGLVGTMAGILVGVGFLVFSGGLNALLSADIPLWFKNTFPNETAIKELERAWSAKGSEGVIALMGGVAIAMISSILGIVFTTWGSNKFKAAKSVVESDKHAFLSWIQAKLLPTLSDNVVGAIREMTGNLTSFNRQFSDNTSNLGAALAKVNESYKLQTQLIDAVNKIQEGRTASTNLTLLSKLIESSEQIGKLAEYLHHTNDYLANVRALNDKLDLHENRTRAVEEMGAFFRTELLEIESRKSAISKAVGTVDDYLQQALGNFKENAEAQFNELQKATVKQQDILLRRAEEIEKLVTELQQLSAVKESISKFEQATRAQNSKLDSLAKAIQALATAKTDGTNAPIAIKTPMQLWKKTLICVGSTLVGLALLALLIANWGSIYYNFVILFRI